MIIHLLANHLLLFIVAWVLFATWLQLKTFD